MKWPARRICALVSTGMVAMLFGAVAACSDDPSPPAAPDSGMDTDGGHSQHEDAGPLDGDSGRAEPPLRCTEAELAENDLTDGGLLEIRFARGANPTQYENRCATVRVGATVRFSGSFRQHPLEPAGGDRPSPIPTIDTDQPDGSLAVTIGAGGTFGFQCTFHPTLMYGAIRAVP